MHIRFHKQTDDRHVLEIERDGAVERVTCDTRSYLVHDLLHYAVEAQARLHGGVWGRLARGQTLALLNDHARKPADIDAELAMVETVVGAATVVLKGEGPESLLRNLCDNADALPVPLPAWLTADFLRAVQNRMRHLLGHWRATPFGEAMTLPWPPQD